MACCGVSLSRTAGLLVRRAVENPFRTESGSAMIPGLEGFHSHARSRFTAAGRTKSVLSQASTAVGELKYCTPLRGIPVHGRWKRGNTVFSLKLKPSLSQCSGARHSRVVFCPVSSRTGCSRRSGSKTTLKLATATSSSHRSQTLLHLLSIGFTNDHR